MGKSKRFQSHFRKSYSGKFTGHPQYIYGEEGKNYKTVGLTTSPVTNGVKNIKLDKNPEPGNNKTSYIRPKPDKASKGSFKERLKGWAFSKSDKQKVNGVIAGEKDKKK